MSEAVNKKACDLMLFGTKGDLAVRKLLPALFHLEKAQLLHPKTKIIGIAREELDTNGYINFVQQNLQARLGESFVPEVWKRFRERLAYVVLDLSQVTDYEKLCMVTDKTSRIPISYFATPPSLYAVLCEGLAHADLCASPARIIMEKPIGHNLETSRKINAQVAKYFKESQVYRIDHYLGKETVLNLLALRFANAFFSANWDRKTINHVQITVAEEVGVEGRWAYYDDVGQMRDMVQNHLLQILSLIAMEPPVSLDAENIRDEKLKVLKALRPIDSSNVREHTVRGQYAKGFINDAVVPGYQDEPGARPASTTETFVALKVAIDNWRWAGVPFYLRTGKRMPQKMSEVVIYFNSQPLNIFHKTCPALPPNKLVIRLQPDEGVEIHMMNKIPGLGEGMRLQQSKLDLNFNTTFQCQRIAEAYERLLLEAMLGNQYLFVHHKEVEQAWQWVDGIIEAWRMTEDKPVPYQAGTWGPAASISLLARNGHSWDE